MSSSTSISSDRSVRHYLVVLTGILLCFGPCAFALSCAGIFFKPVAASLGVHLGTFTFYLTIMLVVTALILPVEGMLMEKFDLRLVLSAGVACIGVPLVAMSFFTAPWQFYIAGAIMGLGLASSLVLAVPTLINRWFQEKVGFYIGLCMAFTGIGGAVFNLVGGHFIDSGPEGWRMGYRVFGILALAVVLPCTALIVRSRPQDVGLLPFGATKVTHQDQAAPQARGVAASQVFSYPAFFTLAIFAALMNLGVNLYQYFAAYASSLTDRPQVVAAAAALASAAMLGQASGKLLIGLINDYVNIKAGFLFATISGLVGLAVIMFLAFSSPVILIGGFIFGIFYASATVLMPLITRSIFGPREYSAIYSRIAMVGALCGAFAVTLWGMSVERFGFIATFSVGLVVIVAALAVGMLTLFLGRKIEY